jgi:hypothetical protein
LKDHFENIIQNDLNNCSNALVKTQKIENFIVQMLKYISDSNVSKNMENNRTDMLYLLAKNFEKDFFDYYLDDKTLNLVGKYTQQIQVMSHKEELEKYDAYRTLSIFINRIKAEFTSSQIWEKLVRETLDCFLHLRSETNIQFNYLASFGSIPSKNIEFCLFVSTEYLSEWSSFPSSINYIPIVFIYDRVRFFAGNPKSFHDELACGISVGADFGQGKVAGGGTLTCFVEDQNKKKYILSAAHVILNKGIIWNLSYRK